MFFRDHSDVLEVAIKNLKKIFRKEEIENGRPKIILALHF
jgi:hypothetical protein